MSDAEKTRPASADQAGAELTALREAAARVQHEVNNPLTALLAEAQLLSLEPGFTAEQRRTIERMVELVRRVIATVRQLDAVKGEPTL
ncbi:MAG TPA: histidine kinase dimerization/phospho-acceptor domain-containing protein [Gemmatimonadaceae bacterium]|nr:histidine kinase dimerization/phospho-acceptor domain-containing protein [Gemmatimonadaceae bacterium]